MDISSLCHSSGRFLLLGLRRQSGRLLLLVPSLTPSSVLMLQQPSPVPAPAVMQQSLTRPPAWPPEWFCPRRQPALHSQAARLRLQFWIFTLCLLFCVFSWLDPHLPVSKFLLIKHCIEPVSKSVSIFVNILFSNYFWSQFCR